MWESTIYSLAFDLLAKLITVDYYKINQIKRKYVNRYETRTLYAGFQVVVRFIGFLFNYFFNPPIHPPSSQALIVGERTSLPLKTRNFNTHLLQSFLVYGNQATFFTPIPKIFERKIVEKKETKGRQISIVAIIKLRPPPCSRNVIISARVYRKTSSSSRN